MEPRISVIARPSIDNAAIKEFLNSRQTVWVRDSESNESQDLVEFSGRVCYMSVGERQSPRNNSEYIENLIQQGHESVLEHAFWTFVLSGVSRAFSHQLVRHRVGFSYSQLSQQYVDQEQFEFVEPFDPSSYPAAAEEWRKAVDSIRQSYRRIKELLQEEVPNSSTFSSKKEFTRFVRSSARSLLPNATETVIVFTANARAIRHFLELRGGIEGDLEMRKVSYELLNVLSKEAPALFRDFYIEYLNDGSPIVRKKTSIPARA